MLQKYFHKLKNAWGKHFKITSMVSDQSHLRIDFETGNAREYKLQEKLTERMKNQFPETLFVLLFVILVDGKPVSKSYGLFYKREVIYGVYLHLERKGELDVSFTPLWSYDEDFESVSRIDEEESAFTPHQEITRTFKEAVLESKEYRLLAVTGLIE